MSFLDYYYGRRGEAKRTERREADRSGPGGLWRRWHNAGRKIQRQPKANPFQIGVLRKNGFFSFTARYFGGREAKLPKGWAPDEAVLNEFHDFLMKTEPEI